MLKIDPIPQRCSVIATFQTWYVTHYKNTLQKANYKRFSSYLSERIQTIQVGSRHFQQRKKFLLVFLKAP